MDGLSKDQNQNHFGIRLGQDRAHGAFGAGYCTGVCGAPKGGLVCMVQIEGSRHGEKSTGHILGMGNIR